uniref:Uncharacterized protein n=1 Tax=Rhizophora mucronata TaxID=61149 RepID=A0A2P2R525_RHIMU
MHMAVDAPKPRTYSVFNISLLWCAQYAEIVIDSRIRVGFGCSKY